MFFWSQHSDLPDMGKALVLVGLLVAGVGALVMLGFPVGRLPGDIVFRRGNVTVFLPFATSVLLSVILTLVLWWLRR